MIKSQTFRLLRIGYRLVPDLSRYWPGIGQFRVGRLRTQYKTTTREPAVPAGHNPNTDPQPPIFGPFDTGYSRFDEIRPDVYHEGKH